MPFGALLGLLGLGGNLLGGLFGGNAATTAAQQQQQAGQQAITTQQQSVDQQVNAQAPYTSAGATSIAELMRGITNGQVGLGASGQVPGFKAPTAGEAEATPGYQFTRDQANKGVLQASAAAGGSITGGTLSAIGAKDTQLANGTYGDTFDRALRGYQANLAGFNTNLAAKQQDFSQLLGVGGIGESATQNVNQGRQVAATNISDLMTQIGNSQAAGTVGKANSISKGLTGGIGALTQGLLLDKLLPTPG